MWNNIYQWSEIDRVVDYRNHCHGGHHNLRSSSSGSNGSGATTWTWITFAVMSKYSAHIDHAPFEPDYNHDLRCDHQSCRWSFSSMAALSFSVWKSGHIDRKLDQAGPKIDQRQLDFQSGCPELWSVAVAVAQRSCMKGNRWKTGCNWL